VTPCIAAVGYQSFGGTCCLHLQGDMTGAEKKGFSLSKLWKVLLYTLKERRKAPFSKAK